MSNNENNFEYNIRQQLTTSLENINGPIQSRLTQARNKALSHSNKPHPHFIKWMLPLISTAVAALLVIILMPSNPQQNEAINMATSEDLIMVSEMEDIELYNNIEFYQWLETIDNNS